MKLDYARKNKLYQEKWKYNTYLSFLKFIMIYFKMFVSLVVFTNSPYFKAVSSYVNYICCNLSRASLVAQTVKNLSEMLETGVLSLGWEDPLEKEMATHSSILAWRIPWTEKSGGLQSVGSQSRTRLSD